MGHQASEATAGPHGERRESGRRPAALSVGVLVPLVLSGCSGVLDPKGPIAAAERTILLNSLAIMLCIVVPTIVATLAFAWWFRASNTKARYRPDWAYSGRLELIVWSIPTMVVMFLGGIAWIGSHDLDPPKPIASPNKTLDVQVVSLDWKWLFIYPEQGVASVNRLVIPVGAPVRFHITSASVMNAFFVPQLGSMIYAMNGMTAKLNLMADQPGSYPGLSAHYSGAGFPSMTFNADAMTPEDFEAWATATRGAGEALDRKAYEALAQQSRSVKPFTYRSVEPGLYEAIVHQAIPPSAGPAHPTPGRSVAPPPHGESAHPAGH